MTRINQRDDDAYYDAYDPGEHSPGPTAPPPPSRRRA